MKHYITTNKELFGGDTWSETCNIAGSSEKFIREMSDEFLSRYVYEYPNGKGMVASVEVTIKFMREPTHKNNQNKKVIAG